MGACSDLGRCLIVATAVYLYTCYYITNVINTNTNAHAIALACYFICCLVALGWLHVGVATYTYTSNVTMPLLLLYIHNITNAITNAITNVIDAYTYNYALITALFSVTATHARCYTGCLCQCQIGRRCYS